jgi:phage terminase large subunit
MNIEDISTRFAIWRERPDIMVRELFGVVLDVWQEKVLQAFPQSPRLAMKACKGPGKTAVLAWIAWNFLLTRLHPIIGATSINAANLKAGLWTELARWYAKSPLLQNAFEITKSEIFAREHPKTWKLEARTWAQDADAAQIGNALAGLHAPYVMWLLDESGDYPEAILPVCEGIFSGAPTEAHIVQAGNPTRLSGPLYRACSTASSLWKVIEITGDPDDPKRSPRIDIEHARAMIKQYGRDNPWILASIFGRFPPASPNALIGPDEVRAAMKRYYREHELQGAPRILGIDVARFGDDASVMASRWGQQMLPLKKWRNVASVQGAAQVSRHWTDWDADAAFIDVTGGFGSGWYDQLGMLGKAPIGVEFSGEAHDKDRYHNKRAEMAFDFVQWIKRGGALPDDDNLLTALTQTTYGFAKNSDRFILEPKEILKQRIGMSPDEFDAAMLTFAEPVSPRNPMATHAHSALDPRCRSAVDPNWGRLPSLTNAVDRSYGRGAGGDYNPFAEIDGAMKRIAGEDR